ncbi:hypothetical protein NX794_07705 [Streptomyces sp. LP11]|uniref:Uncharacterized protein n=1 Tax=Streptomyces pyxinicus TaxID=2970331 RepID=A0ABT2AY80_9ACTN|nr:hypothetical protein [Streptomyces sp. LP11]MCS0601115.1 hypothetical protein [Streptomyces sp. LP11]
MPLHSKTLLAVPGAALSAPGWVHESHCDLARHLDALVKETLRYTHDLSVHYAEFVTPYGLMSKLVIEAWIGDGRDVAVVYWHHV